MCNREFELVIEELHRRLDDCHGVQRQRRTVAKWAVWARGAYPNTTNAVLGLQAVFLTFDTEPIMNIDKFNKVEGDGNRVDSGNVVGDKNITSTDGAAIENAAISSGEEGALTPEVEEALGYAKSQIKELIKEPSDRDLMVAAVAEVERRARSKASKDTANDSMERIKNIAQTAGGATAGIYYSMKLVWDSMTN